MSGRKNFFYLSVGSLINEGIKISQKDCYDPIFSGDLQNRSVCGLLKKLQNIFWIALNIAE